MIWGCMSHKGTGEIAVITSSINEQVYVEILDTFLIQSIERGLVMMQSFFKMRVHRAIGQNT